MAHMIKLKPGTLFDTGIPKKLLRISIDTLIEKLGLIEPRREKTGLRDFRPGPTQTGLYKLRKELEA